ncbi:MAG: ABC-2 transporter permease [Acetatifactor sp.]|nr:ABC-2 transporter permease [Acetatifactor sp.]
MLGLIIKDIRLIKNQGIVMILAFVGVMGIVMANTMDSPGGFVAYATVMGVIYAFNTISYDNYENGYAFLFTLPVSRRLYAAEKYVLALLFSGGACLVSGAVAEVIWGSGPEFATHCSIYLVTWITLLWMPIVMLPLQLKFGAEKSRIVTIIVFGIGAALVYLAASSEGKFVENVAGWMTRLSETVGEGGMLAFAVLITAAAFALSMGISMHIMERKEF